MCACAHVRMCVRAVDCVLLCCACVRACCVCVVCRSNLRARPLALAGVRVPHDPPLRRCPPPRCERLCHQGNRPSLEASFLTHAAAAPCAAAFGSLVGWLVAQRG